LIDDAASALRQSWGIIIVLLFFRIHFLKIC
jgi:hypothetical protein